MSIPLEQEIYCVVRAGSGVSRRPHRADPQQWYRVTDYVAYTHARRLLRDWKRRESTQRFAIARFSFHSNGDFTSLTDERGTR